MRGLLARAIKIRGAKRRGKPGKIHRAIINHVNSNAKARRAMVGQPHPPLDGNIWQTNLFHNCIIMANIIATQEWEGLEPRERIGDYGKC